MCKTTQLDLQKRVLIATLFFARQSCYNPALFIVNSIILQIGPQTGAQTEVIIINIKKFFFREVLSFDVFLPFNFWLPNFVKSNLFILFEFRKLPPTMLWLFGCCRHVKLTVPSSERKNNSTTTTGCIFKKFILPFEHV